MSAQCHVNDNLQLVESRFNIHRAGASQRGNNIYNNTTSDNRPTPRSDESMSQQRHAHDPAHRNHISILLASLNQSSNNASLKHDQRALSYTSSIPTIRPRILPNHRERTALDRHNSCYTRRPNTLTSPPKHCPPLTSHHPPIL